MSAPTLLLIGSGPGIGLSTSILFAQKKFAKVALVSRNATRLAAEANTVASSATQDEKEIDVKTWAVDITDSPAFTHVLSEVGAWGDVTCVIFNAARVQPSALLEESDEEILEDFKVGFSLLMRNAAGWWREISDEGDIGDDHCAAYYRFLGYAPLVQEGGGGKAESAGDEQLAVETAGPHVLLAVAGEVESEKSGAEPGFEFSQ